MVKIACLMCVFLALAMGHLCYPEYDLYGVEIRSHRNGPINYDVGRDTIRIRYDFEGINVTPSQEHYLRTRVVPSADHWIR
jgi:hypothetical protein